MQAHDRADAERRDNARKHGKAEQVVPDLLGLERQKPGTIREAPKKERDPGSFRVHKRPALSFW